MADLLTFQAEARARGPPTKDEHGVGSWHTQAAATAEASTMDGRRITHGAMQRRNAVQEEVKSATCCSSARAQLYMNKYIID
jgi:hypothetical protein